MKTIVKRFHQRATGSQPSADHCTGLSDISREWLFAQNCDTRLKRGYRPCRMQARRQRKIDKIDIASRQHLGISASVWDIVLIRECARTYGITRGDADNLGIFPVRCGADDGNGCDARGA
jgi:hypothetical protein